MEDKLKTNEDSQEIQDTQATESASPIARPNLERPLRGGWPGASIFLDRNKKLVSYVSGGIIVVILAILGYKYFILAPQEEEARKALFKNQRLFESDSFNLALRGSGADPGMQELADDYGSTQAGNLAKYYTGMSLMHQGKYEEAIDYLKGFHSNSEIIEPLALGAIGDAYSQLKQYENASSYYGKAAKASDNKFTTPRFLFKEGMVAEKLGNFQEALDAYKTIKEKYSSSQQGMDIDKYIARAQAEVASK